MTRVCLCTGTLAFISLSGRGCEVRLLFHIVEVGAPLRGCFLCVAFYSPATQLVGVFADGDASEVSRFLYFGSIGCFVTGRGWSWVS